MTRRPQKPAVAQASSACDKLPVRLQSDHHHCYTLNIHHHTTKQSYTTDQLANSTPEIPTHKLPTNRTHNTQTHPSQWTKQRSSSRCRASSSRTAASSSPGAASVRLHSSPPLSQKKRNQGLGAPPFAGRKSVSCVRSRQIATNRSSSTTTPTLKPKHDHV